jgi:hypothetical protein
MRDHSPLRGKIDDIHAVVRFLNQSDESQQILGTTNMDICVTMSEKVLIQNGDVEKKLKLRTREGELDWELVYTTRIVTVSLFSRVVNPD